MAVGDNTAALVVALEAKIDKFQSDLEKAAGIAERTAGRIEQRFKGLRLDFGGELAGMALRLATLAGIGETVAKTMEAIKDAARLQDVAERVGLTTDRFQELRFAAVATGASAETADSFMQRFSRSISEAGRGSGELFKFLRLNKVELHDSATGALLPMNVQLGNFANLVRNTKSPLDQMNLAIMAGGRQAGPEFLAALRSGSEGLARFGDEAQRAGAVLGPAFIDRAKEIQRAFDILKLRIGVGFQEAAVGVAEETQGMFAKANEIGSTAAEQVKSVFAGLKSYIESNHPDWAAYFGGAVDAVSTATGIIKKRLEDEGVIAAARRGPQSEVGAPVGRGLGGEAGDDRRNRVPDRGNDTTRMVNEQADAFKKLIDTQQSRIRLLGAEAQAVGLSAGAAEALKTQVQLENAAKQQNIPLTEARKAAILDEARKTGEAAQVLDDYRRRWNGVNSAAQFAGDQAIGVLDGLRNKTLSTSQAVSQLANAFIHAAEQALFLGSGPLAGLLGTSSNIPGGTGGIIGSLLGAFRPAAAGIGGGAFGPSGFGFYTGNAYGTDFWRGGPTWLHEKGRELVDLPSGSRVTPAHLSSPKVEFNVSVQDYNDSRVSVNKRQNESGGFDVGVAIRGAVNQGFSTGEFDKSAGGRFGVAPQGVKR